MSRFRLWAAFCPNTSLLISHEATASLLLRASSPNKIRRQIRKRPNSDSRRAARAQRPLAPGRAAGVLPERRMTAQSRLLVRQERIGLPGQGESLGATLSMPTDPAGLVIFAHGSGSSRFSPRNRLVANRLGEAGCATLLTDLLTQREESADAITAEFRFDIPLLAQRLIVATEHMREHLASAPLPIGYFGASTGAAAALIAAAQRPRWASAVVSHGGYRAKPQGTSDDARTRRTGDYSAGDASLLKSRARSSASRTSRPPGSRVISRRRSDPLFAQVLRARGERLALAPPPNAQASGNHVPAAAATNHRSSCLRYARHFASTRFETLSRRRTGRGGKPTTIEATCSKFA